MSALHYSAAEDCCFSKEIRPQGGFSFLIVHTMLAFSIIYVVNLSENTIVVSVWRLFDGHDRKTNKKKLSFDLLSCFSSILISKPCAVLNVTIINAFAKDSPNQRANLWNRATALILGAQESLSSRIMPRFLTVDKDDSMTSTTS